MKPNLSPERVPEERVGAILRRAAELDRKAGDSVDLDAIRSAALEAGISLAAVNRALEEYAAGSPPIPIPAVVRSAEQTAPPRGLRRWLRKLVDPLKFAVAGWVLGLTGGAGEVAVVVPWVGLLYVAWLLIKRYRPTQDTVAFVVSTSLLTIGTLIGYAVVAGDEDVLSVLLLTGIALLPVGSAAIKWMGRSEQLQETSASTR
jgi:hypothetical protein